MNPRIKIILVACFVVLFSLAGGLAYYSHVSNAQSIQKRLERIAEIDKQHEKEYATEIEKADSPKVDENNPARYVVENDPVEEPNPKDQVPNQTESPAVDPVPEVTQDTEPAKDAPVVPAPESPTLTTEPPEEPEPEVKDEPVAKITSLSDADIERLQGYPIDYSQGESYFSFNDMYTNHKNSCDALLEKFSPVSLHEYYKAKVEWLTDPKLVYRNAIAQYCVRGVLTLTYYSEDNPFGLTPNTTYQSEVEYRLRNSVTGGQMTLKLENINYLSGFKAVK